MQLVAISAKLSAADVLAHVESRVLASEMSDADVALTAKLDALATKAGGLLNIDFRLLSADEWARAEALNDLGLL